MDRKTKKLVKQLENEDPKERYLAAGELAKLRAVEALPKLDRVATLDDNKSVREMAYKAVRFLTVLKDQMDQDELRRRIEADDDDDDDPAGWSDIDSILEPSQERITSKIKTMKGYTSVFTIDDDDDDGGSEQRFQENFEAVDYSDIDLGLYPDLMLDDEPIAASAPVAPTTAEASRSKSTKRGSERSKRENKRGSTFRFRMVLWLSVAVAVIALGIVAREELGLDEEGPQSREAVLDGLEAWYSNMLGTTNRYFTATVTASTFDCASYIENSTAYAIPAPPAWAEPGAEYQEDLDDYFAGMETATTNLTEVQRLLNAHCERDPNRSELPGRLSETIREQLTATLTTLNTQVLRDLNAARRDLEAE